MFDAAGMTDGEMQNVTASAGRESGFVFSAPATSNCDFDFEFRVWVPEYKKEMCVRASVLAAQWVLAELGGLPKSE